ncbi:GlxA family transcriptional regulator [Pendulispora albinea]|uniref:GlxA family transcriptional regulator n=1 Tax=Pendulispora albinea TaxID=2741071 RepID=A0ABZ2M190_9BACT
MIPAKTRRIVFLALPPIEELDLIGPLSVFSAARRFLGREPAYDIRVVSDREGLMQGEAGVSMLAHGHFRDLRGKIDTLLVAGGSGAESCRDAEVLRWLRTMAPRVRRLGSICSGAFVLAEAGLLDGRCASTHWQRASALAARYPKVRVEPDPIFTRDGNIYTSAGVSAGMDLAMELVEDDLGGEIALKVARALVLFLRRPGGQAQFSVTLAAQAVENRPLRELQVWMAEHLELDLSVEKLAARMAMSPRNFARVFRRDVGITPARYVEQLRLEAARRLLERTHRSTEEIAAACGYSSAELMRVAFLRTLQVSPRRYRDHFRHLGARPAAADPRPRRAPSQRS